MTTTLEPRAVPTESGRPRARWSRLAATGLLLAALAPASFFIAAAFTGLLGEDTSFFVVATIVPLVGAFLVWRFGTWAKFVGILAGLAVGMALFWTVFSIAHTASVLDFMAAILVPLGVGLGVGGSIAAMVRRKTLTPRATGAERVLIRAALGVVAAAVLVSGALYVTNRETVAPGTQADLAVRMHDFAFDDRSYELRAGPRTILVRNNDPFLHTFTIDALGVDETVLPGNAKLIEIDAVAGSYVLYCVPHTHDPEAPSAEDMAAALEVR